MEVTWKYGTGSISARRRSKPLLGLCGSGTQTNCGWHRSARTNILDIALLAAPNLAAKSAAVRQLRMSSMAR